MSLSRYLCLNILCFNIENKYFCRERLEHNTLNKMELIENTIAIQIVVNILNIK